MLIDGLFHCSGCQKSFNTKAATRKYFERTEYGKEQSGLPLVPVTIPDAISLVVSPPTADPLPATRGHDDVTLYACQQMHASESDKVKTLFITESLGLTPFVLKDTLGNDQSALVHPDVLKKLTVGQLQFSAIMPDSRKRKFVVDSLCQNCLPSSVPESSWTKNPAALVLAAIKKAWAVSTRGLLYQLRQVKTKVHEPSNYLWCRGSSHFSRSYACQPYSIFNLTNFDQCHSGNESAAGAFFMISKEVSRNGSSATLKLGTIQESLVQCAEHSQIVKAFETILALFPAGATFDTDPRKQTP
ncbi:hypothetical protein KVV02_001674 [Mortierella alpina]|uniref:Uncharacterized protein n=1 Tax=Mortierella alpina TaxID=64518 RepID=A0A9P8A5H5_MORAP|nr:hypothetical protein KVV02_001674 [Mortierella alpina]